ncbi:MAG: hypothetical protein SFT91_05325 [Rickettsiaceae bacterium]|nr:hypothetical protein [Rickettsiaceae bacterium]
MYIITKHTLTDYISLEVASVQVHLTFSINEQFISSEESENFLRVIRRNENLKTLEIRYHYMTTEFLYKICQEIKIHPTLKSLSLPHSCILPEGPNFIREIVSANTHLVCLDLSHNSMNDRALEIICTGLHNNKFIKSLILKNCSIGTKGAIHISNMIALNQNIAKIDLSHNEIGTVGAKYISMGLKANNTLAEISLQSNKINDMGVIFLAKSLKHSKVLTDFDIQENVVTEDGIKEIAYIVSNSNIIRYINSYVESGISEAQFYEIWALASLRLQVFESNSSSMQPTPRELGHDLLMKCTNFLREIIRLQTSQNYQLSFNMILSRNVILLREAEHDLLNDYKLTWSQINTLESHFDNVHSWHRAISHATRAKFALLKEDLSYDVFKTCVAVNLHILNQINPEDDGAKMQKNEKINSTLWIKTKHLAQLPTEIIEKIFTYMGDNLGQTQNIMGVIYYNTLLYKSMVKEYFCGFLKDESNISVYRNQENDDIYKVFRVLNEARKNATREESINDALSDVGLSGAFSKLFFITKNEIAQEFMKNSYANTQHYSYHMNMNQNHLGSSFADTPHSEPMQIDDAERDLAGGV